MQRGIREATGDFILVRDADLECDPADYVPTHEAIRTGRGVFTAAGLRSAPSRRVEPDTGSASAAKSRPVAGGRDPVIVDLRALPDLDLRYADRLQIYPREVSEWMQMKTRGFETDHEITAKLARAGFKIREAPISYRPRSAEEGKKIKARDGFVAVWTLLRFRYG